MVVRLRVLCCCNVRLDAQSLRSAVKHCDAAFALDGTWAKVRVKPCMWCCTDTGFFANADDDSRWSSRLERLPGSKRRLQLEVQSLPLW